MFSHGLQTAVVFDGSTHFQSELRRQNLQTSGSPDAQKSSGVFWVGGEFYFIFCLNLLELFWWASRSCSVCRLLGVNLMHMAVGSSMLKKINVKKNRSTVGQKWKWTDFRWLGVCWQLLHYKNLIIGPKCDP